LKSIFICFAILFFSAFTSCEKDSYKRIKYRVVSKSNAEIVYGVHGNYFYETNIKGDWNKSFRVKRESSYYLSAIKTGPLLDVSILIYVDGKLHATESTEDMFGFIELKGTVPLK
tara:strand:- start:585 stop:929 length:345 start_codon:yes stop_codon:yes gene_type:complete